MNADEPRFPIGFQLGIRRLENIRLLLWTKRRAFFASCVHLLIKKRPGKLELILACSNPHTPPFIPLAKTNDK
jgi:hypothetical protein